MPRDFSLMPPPSWLRPRSRTVAFSGALFAGALALGCSSEEVPVVQPEATLEAYFLDSYDSSRDRFR